MTQQFITTAIYVNAGRGGSGGYTRHGFLIQRIDALNGQLIENVGFLDAGFQGKSALRYYFPDAIELYTLSIDGKAWKELMSHRIMPANPEAVHSWPEKDQCQTYDNWGKKCTHLAGWLVSYDPNPVENESIKACPFHVQLVMSEMISTTGSGMVYVSHYTS